MKLVFTILLLQLLLSCNNSGDSSSSKTKTDKAKVTTHKVSDEQVFAVDKAKILKDFNTWYNYTYFNIVLSQDFIGLNVDSVEIDKISFLNMLIKDNVVAFKIKQLQTKPVYKLYLINKIDKDIKSTIKQLASIEMQNDKMQGKQIPKFSFTDITGKNYSSVSTKGKIVVLKCWFIKCGACVKEFPACNDLVNEYKNRNDILFISLASDTKAELKKFLKTKTFNYSTIPKADDYMTTKLNVNSYPTHLLIGKNGKIIKVVNTIEELEPFLKIEANK